MGTRAIAVILVLCFVASPVLAEEVLYCTDTAATGFAWQNGQASPSLFNPERFTIKVTSDTERVITRMVGDTAGRSLRYRCRHAFEQLACDPGDGALPWLFAGNAYTRAFLAGPPVGGGDQNIWIAYGICTKF